MVIYIDVDDTLIRSVGSKRIPMTMVVNHVRDLHKRGETLYLWSTGGADYARQSAAELDLTECFVGFLPKPQLIIDDQNISEWRDFQCVHPLAAPGS